MKEESMFVVCISDGFLKLSKNNNKPPSSATMPKKGEIYEPVRHVTIMGMDAYVLAGFHPHDCWNAKSFRPVDSGFGEVVCSWAEETILKIAQLEEAEA